MSREKIIGLAAAGLLAAGGMLAGPAAASPSSGPGAAKGQESEWNRETRDSLPASATLAETVESIAGEVHVESSAVGLAAMPRCNSTAKRMFNITESGSHQIAIFQPSYNGSFDCFLNYDLSINQAVKPLQNSLRYCYGFDDILVDGSFGAKTRDRLKQVQAMEGIAVDGSMGPVTRTKMAWWAQQHGGCYSFP